MNAVRVVRSQADQTSQEKNQRVLSCLKKRKKKAENEAVCSKNVTDFKDSAGIKINRSSGIEMENSTTKREAKFIQISTIELVGMTVFIPEL